MQGKICVLHFRNWDNKNTAKLRYKTVNFLDATLNLSNESYKYFKILKKIDAISHQMVHLFPSKFSKNQGDQLQLKLQ